jgi:uncharacterized repeat protein (TIGR01451 family)
MALHGARTLILAGLAAFFAVATAQAQTPEGTTIRNIATVDYEDGDGFTYTQVADTVDITVGFLVGISTTPDGGTATPASPSTGGTLAFTIENVGNGVDTVTASEVETDVDNMMTITNYNWNSGDYASLALLNADLDGYELTAGATTVITITYDIAADKGGSVANYELTATSVRDGGETDPGDYDLTAGETFGVTVWEQSSTQDTLSDNLMPGTGQTVVFRVTNTGNGTESFTLLTRQDPATMLSVTGMAGTGVSQGGDPDSARVTDLGVGAFVDVTVTFDVAELAAGTIDSLFFQALSLAQPATEDEGGYIVTLVRPVITILKEACDDTPTCPLAGNPIPGDTIQYRVTVTNNGTADASNVVVNDVLPGEVTYDTYTNDGNWASINEAAGTVTATLSGTLASGGGSAYFYIRVSIN